MEKVKEELQNCLNDLLYTELGEIYIEAFARVANSAYQELNDIKDKKSSRLLEARQKEIGRVLYKIQNNKVLFLKWLSENRADLYEEVENIVKEKHPERTAVLMTLDPFMDFLNLEKTDIFLEFDEMARVLKYVDLNTVSQIVLFSTIVRNNIALDSDPEVRTFITNVSGLLDYEYQHLTKNEVMELLKNDKLEEYLKDENPENPEAQEELSKRFHKTKFDYTDRQTSCRHLDAIFRKKLSELTEEDYQTITVNMSEIFFDHLAYRLISFLKKNNSSHKNLYEFLESKRKVVEKTKATKKTKTPETENGKEKKKRQQETPKKQTNLNQTIREINKYFDLDTLELKEELSLDQIIYTLSLMYSINVEEAKTETFLRSTMRIFKEFHPYAILHQAYDKFAYLREENSEVKEHLDMIKYILSDASIFICDEETYASTKELVSEELKEIMRIINGNYTFEKEEAKKLLNANKE